MFDGEIGRDGQPNWVVAPDGCWIWRRNIRDGYGQIKRDRRVQPAHRYIWEQAHGPIAAGLELDHLCRNRACVNPAHLEPVSRAQNCRRGATAALGPLAVKVIRQSKRSSQQLAQVFGVSPSTITNCRGLGTYPEG